MAIAVARKFATRGSILNENNNNKKDVTPLLVFYIPKCVSGTEPQPLNFFLLFLLLFFAENNGRLYKVN